uniref:Uncharacterized protein n=1 Tax=Lactuca sativa TaxID=4236 RepID=A0A9R1UIQ6_LACSA|nr:hypothetical protein LSAT_V11C900456390 [Lactuca sativa]
MASSQCPTNRNFIVVDFHYNGTFAPNPLVYFDPGRLSVRDVDFSAFEYEEFMAFLHKLTRINVDDVYEDVEYVEPQYHVHDDRQPWNQMNHC